MSPLHALILMHLGTGFSEQQLEERSASLRSKVIEKPKVIYLSLLFSDWFFWLLDIIIFPSH